MQVTPASVWVFITRGLYCLCRPLSILHKCLICICLLIQVCWVCGSNNPGDGQDVFIPRNVRDVFIPRNHNIEHSSTFVSHIISFRLMEPLHKSKGVR